MSKKHIVFNIGCIECGVSSNLVGVFDSAEKAAAIAEHLQDELRWREGGQNSFEVFELNEINKEYLEFLPTQPDDHE